jgi:hypothetical protein
MKAAVPIAATTIHNEANRTAKVTYCMRGLPLVRGQCLNLREIADRWDGFTKGLPKLKIPSIKGICYARFLRNVNNPF